MELSHQLREEYEITNDLAQTGSEYKEPMGADQINIQKRLLPSVHMRGPMIAPVEIVKEEATFDRLSKRS